MTSSVQPKCSHTKGSCFGEAEESRRTQQKQRNPEDCRGLELNQSGFSFLVEGECYVVINMG